MLLNRPHRPARRGLAAMETLLVLPVLIGMILASVGFADLLVAEQKLDEASGRAARVASLGGSDDQIKEAVRAVLGPERGEHAEIVLTPIPATPKRNSGNVENERPDGEAGTDEATPGLQLVEVRVEIQVRHAAATGFIPLSGSTKLMGRTVVHQQ